MSRKYKRYWPEIEFRVSYYDDNGILHNFTANMHDLITNNYDEYWVDESQNICIWDCYNVHKITKIKEKNND